MNKIPRKYLLLFVGFTGGFFSALLGIGGGVIFVPVLLFLGYGKQAMGTSLAAIIPSVFIGLIAHYLIDSQNIHFLMAAITVAGAILGAKLGAEIVQKLNIKVLKLLILLLLILAGIKYIDIIPSTEQSITELPPACLALLGLLAGISSATFGIGGGIIMVPGFNILFGLPLHEAIPTSLASILPTTITATIFHMRFDNISTKAIKHLIPTAFLGALTGAVVTNHLPTTVLRTTFGFFLVIAMVFSFLRMFHSRDNEE